MEQLVGQALAKGGQGNEAKREAVGQAEEGACQGMEARLADGADQVQAEAVRVPQAKQSQALIG